MFSIKSLRYTLVLGIALTEFLIAGCAVPPKISNVNQPETAAWSGRISLQLMSDPPQYFSAKFELQGQPEHGELSLISPFGNVLGVLHWSPGQAYLDQGKQQPKQFSSLDALMVQTIGTPVPVTALFSWLKGDNATVPGWSADLSKQNEGRISAKRNQPEPTADLRVVLDR